jgi:uncharacterized membrane protein
MNNLLFVLTLCAVLGCGLMAGVFFAFSTFIMRALARLQPAQGIEAMQSINRTVINPWFLGVFLGTAAVCILLAGSALWRWQQPGAVYLLAGSLLYLIDTVLVTVVFNVPMNNALENIDPASSDASGQWASYLARWTAWNHVRTAAALLGAASFMLALW